MVLKALNTKNVLKTLSIFSTHCAAHGQVSYRILKVNIHLMQRVISVIKEGEYYFFEIDMREYFGRK